MAITKAEIKRQVYALMKERSTAIHKFVQDQAYHVRSEAFGMDAELKKYHDEYYKAVDIAARCARDLADKGLGSMRNVSHSQYVLDRCWKVSTSSLIESCLRSRSS